MRRVTLEHPVPDHGPQYLVRLAVLVAALLALALGAGTLLAEESAARDDGEEAASSYIVKGASAERMAELVAEVGGKVTHELSIIRAVGAELTDAQRDALAEHPEVARVWRDREAEVQDDRPGDG